MNGSRFKVPCSKAPKRVRGSAAQRMIRFTRRAGFIPPAKRVQGHRSATSLPVVWGPLNTLENIQMRILPRRAEPATSAVSPTSLRTGGSAH